MAPDSKRRYDDCDPVFADMEAPTTKKAKTSTQVNTQSKRTLKETANYKKLKTILDNWALFRTRLRNENVPDDLQDRLMNYYDKMRPRGGVVPIVYSTKKNNPLGRVYAEGMSYQSMPREIRHTLAYEDYYDLDIVNSAPTIIYQQYRSVVKLPVLQRYTESYDNRRAMLAEVAFAICRVSPTWDTVRCSEEAKELFIIPLNGGKGRTAGIRYQVQNFLPTWFFEYEAECKAIQDYVREAEVALVERIEKRKGEDDKWNVLGAVVEHLYERAEARIMWEVEKILIEWKWIQADYASPIHDGIQLLKRYVDPYRKSDSLELLSSLIKERTTFKVAFKFKEFDLAWTDVLETQDTRARDLRPHGTKHIDVAVELLSTTLNGRVKRRELGGVTNYFYLQKNGLWTPYKNVLANDMFVYVAHMNIHVARAKDGSDAFTSDYSHADKIVRTALSLIPEPPNMEEWHMRLVQGPVGKVVMRNGYYDGDLGEFCYNMNGIDSMIRIDRLYQKASDEMMQEVKDKLLIPILGPETCETYRCFMLVIARALFGRRGKYSVTLVGKRNRGKTLLFSALTYAMDQYAKVFEAGVIMDGHSEGSAVRSNDIFIQVQGKRLAFTDEGPDKDMNEKIVKEWQSTGLMPKIARGLYEPPQAVYNVSLLVLCGNTLPRMKDAAQRNIPLRCNTEFVSRGQLAENATKQFPRDNLVLANPEMENYIYSEGKANALLQIIFDTYHENKDQDFEWENFPEIMEWRDQELGTSDNRRWEQCFVMSEDPDDEVTLSKIKSTFSNKNIRMTAIQLEAELKEDLKDSTGNNPRTLIIKKRNGKSRYLVMKHCREADANDEDV